MIFQCRVMKLQREKNVCAFYFEIGRTSNCITESPAPWYASSKAIRFCYHLSTHSFYLSRLYHKGLPTTSSFPEQNTFEEEKLWTFAARSIPLQQRLIKLCLMPYLWLLKAAIYVEFTHTRQFVLQSKHCCAVKTTHSATRYIIFLKAKNITEIKE